MTVYDYAKRRRAHRRGREKGCHVYIAADDLRRAGLDPDTWPVWYRVWAGPRGCFVVVLYGEA